MPRSASASHVLPPTKTGPLGVRRLTPFFYVAPAMTVMLVMVTYPIAYGTYLAMTNMSLQNYLNYRFIGLTNFARITQESEVRLILLRTIAWTAINVTFHVVIGVWLAILLNRRLPGRTVFRSLLILPWAMPQYISVLTWKTMFHHDFGAVNVFLRTLGLESKPWLSDPNLAFAAVTITNIWLGVPFMMMVALGGLQAIPREYYEAAEIDGTGSWSSFRHITVPMLKPVMIPAIVLGVVWTFNMLNVIYLMTLGGPGNSTHILVTYVYRSAFDFYRYGYASAVSVLIFLILILFSWAFLRASRAEMD